jgi:Gluconate 2-dehydrogenase subunit 3
VNAADFPKLSRRTTLKWIGVFAGYTAFPISFVSAQSVSGFNPTPTGYGTDPKLNDPVVTWQRIMTERELLLSAAFSDLILPATTTAPAPTAIGVPDFLDEWISAPYPEQQADRPVVLGGLAWLDGEARRRWEHGFVEATDSERRQILDDIVAGNAEAAVWRGFFFRLRFLVVGAYFTTQPGFDDIGYIGNVRLDAYPAPTDAEIAILEAHLKKLGL